MNNTKRRIVCTVILRFFLGLFSYTIGPLVLGRCVRVCNVPSLATLNSV
jgi:hypothetical protein